MLWLLSVLIFASDMSEFKCLFPIRVNFVILESIISIKKIVLFFLFPSKEKKKDRKKMSSLQHYLPFMSSLQSYASRPSQKTASVSQVSSLVINAESFLQAMPV